MVINLTGINSVTWTEFYVIMASFDFIQGNLI